ncbi:MAG TPA: glycosyltransferase family 39 protein, partial [Candidatus Angelobacter sp.]|nr:glycosyltransferase family 39 protein [Candidatus Angelobacter sp.]
MLQLLREFKVGRPQVFAGLMLLAFLAQCLWAAKTRAVADLEYRYIAAGLPSAETSAEIKTASASPLTGWVAALPVRAIPLIRKVASPTISEALAVPRPWLLRLPFVLFGFWLGAALWWVARRLFDDAGGYVALALYCTSPAMIKISSNIGPEIILAWSGLGLIYTAIGVAHTLYAPPRKWAPRIVILGLSIGFALATAWWSFTLVLLAFAYMIYLAPGCRKKVMIVLSGASAIGCVVWAAAYWLTGSAGLSVKMILGQKTLPEGLHDLFLTLWDGFPLYLTGIWVIATLVHEKLEKRKRRIWVDIAIGLAVSVLFAFIQWLSSGDGFIARMSSAFNHVLKALESLLFVLSARTDGYVLVLLFILAFTAYGSWARARYFGNTAPLITGLAAVFLFSLVPALRIWSASLGLSFVFIFIGGIAADFLETRFKSQIALFLAACFAIRAV